MSCSRRARRVLDVIRLSISGDQIRHLNCKKCKIYANNRPLRYRQHNHIRKCNSSPAVQLLLPLIVKGLLTFSMRAGRAEAASGCMLKPSARMRLCMRLQESSTLKSGKYSISLNLLFKPAEKATRGDNYVVLSHLCGFSNKVSKTHYNFLEENTAA